MHDIIVAETVAVMSRLLFANNFLTISNIKTLHAKLHVTCDNRLFTNVNCLAIQTILPVGSSGGRVGPCVQFLRRAMGFRRVSDLSEYSVSELLDLIEKATKLVRDKLDNSWDCGASGVSSSGYSVVEPEPAGASSSAAVPRNAAGLKSPYTCDFHCKFCQSQCCRPHPHKNHACIEHRKWR